MQCRSCSLIYANPFPVPGDLETIYGDPESYFGRHDSGSKITANRLILREMKRLLGKSCLRVLDVGSGQGELLVAAREEAIEAMGLEVAEPMIAYALNHYSVKLHKLSIEMAADQWAQSFDGIVLNAVLEHVHNPDSMIRSAAALIKPGGILYIDVPNEPNLLTFIGNAWNRLKGSRIVYNLSPTWEPYHVYGFNPKSLHKLLGKHRFTIERLHSACESSIQPVGHLRDHARTWVANRLNTLANLTSTSPNLSLWARKER